VATRTQQITSGLWREDLHERLGWLIQLRWLAVLGLCLTILIARYGLHLHPALAPLLGANVALLVCNAVYGAVWWRWKHAPLRRLIILGVVQTILDFVILVFVLHYTGGIENPLVVMFVFQCIIASMLFTPMLSYLLAALAFALVSAMVAFEHTRIWPHWHLDGYLHLEMADQGLFIGGMLASVAVLLFVSVYLTTTIETASRKRRAEAVKRALELEEAREQIQQADKMAALGEMAASMAHDINNPAGVICSRFDIMEAEGLFDNLPARVRQDLMTLRKHAHYLRRIAENWTSFARKSTGHGERIDLNHEVRHMAAMVAESLQQHDIDLILDLHGAPLWVFGDPVRVHQAVLNLINNARAAMPGGGTLTVRTQSENSAEQTPVALLKISDTGSGIAPDKIEHVFEPFFSGKPEGQGTGLGLAICQKVVKEMDGEIAIHSEIGAGTTFAIRIPLSESSGRVKQHV
jgi:signal transduction histidine kinase